MSLYNKSVFVGFRTGFKTSDSCLEKYLGISLSRKSLFYPDGFALETALVNGEVSVLIIIRLLRHT